MKDLPKMNNQSVPVKNKYLNQKFLHARTNNNSDRKL
jgi:hypothetical protein